MWKVHLCKLACLKGKCMSDRHVSVKCARRACVYLLPQHTLLWVPILRRRSNETYGFQSWAYVSADKFPIASLKILQKLVSCLCHGAWWHEKCWDRWQCKIIDWSIQLTSQAWNSSNWTWTTAVFKIITTGNDDMTIQSNVDVKLDVPNEYLKARVYQNHRDSTLH